MFAPYPPSLSPASPTTYATPMLLSITHSPTGLVHLIAALIALVAGTGVLLADKGTRLHVRAGYVYVAAMVVMLAMAFGIYHLYGSFAVFHWLALVSVLTLLGGMVSVVLRRPRAYMSLHLSFMYWSVAGLYMAFVAETAVRFADQAVASGVPTATFYYFVAGSGLVVMVAANVCYYRFRPR